MKYLNILVIIIAVALISCGDSETTITVNLDEQIPADGLVTFQRLTVDGKAPMDTVQRLDSVTYQTQIVLDSPAFYRMNINNKYVIVFAFDGKEGDIEVTYDENFPSVTGSDQTAAILDIDRYVYDLRVKKMELDKEGQQRMAIFNQKRTQLMNQGVEETDPQIVELRTNLDRGLGELSSEWARSFEEYNKGLQDKIRDITPSLASVYSLRFLNPNQDLDFYDSIVTTNYEAMPNDPIVSEIYNKFVQDKEKKQGANTGPNVGDLAPDITLPTPEGENFSLSKLKGNYVLLDFWAGWCRPCRVENPNVVRLYNKYQDENFEILSVSLDKTRKQWVDAIAQDKMTWYHISDLKYWDSEAAKIYKISSIPATYLLDPEGRIIAKNLRGPSLATKLQELFEN